MQYEEDMFESLYSHLFIFLKSNEVLILSVNNISRIILNRKENNVLLEKYSIKYFI